MIRERVLEWEKFRDDLLKAIAEGDGSHTEDDVLARILAGEYRLWVFEKCAFVTFIWKRPQFTALYIYIAGGDLDALIAEQPNLEMWAKANGCARVYSAGRVGWERVFPDYKKLGVTYAKEL